jgi:hypothetical protein
MYVAVILCVVLPFVYGQAGLWSQCEWLIAIGDQAKQIFRRRNRVDRSNYMCFWVVLYLFESMVFPMSSMHCGYKFKHRCDEASSNVDYIANLNC